MTLKRTKTTVSERAYMERAVEAMQKSQTHGPKVGAVLVVNGDVVADGYRINGKHAERVAIEATLNAGIDVKGGTIYTTLEPCVADCDKANPKQSCSELIIEHGIAQVIIGRYDPNPKINRLGWKALNDAGVVCRDFDGDLRNRIDELNAGFMEHFVRAVGPKGAVTFDYMLNEKSFEIQYASNDERTILTRWSTRSGNSIYAYGNYDVQVARAKFAESLAAIDDPLSYDFAASTEVNVGEVVIFANATSCALVRVNKVLGGPDYGSDVTLLSIEFEVRLAN